MNIVTIFIFPPSHPPQKKLGEKRKNRDNFFYRDENEKEEKTRGTSIGYYLYETSRLVSFQRSKVRVPTDGSCP